MYDERQVMAKAHVALWAKKESSIDEAEYANMPNWVLK